MFHQLFKKYRLRSEIATYRELADLMVQTEGFLYEESLFSHWQRGARIPQNRAVLIKLLKIFVSREGVTSLSQANEFLEAAGQGYLTDNEQAALDIP